MMAAKHRLAGVLLWVALLAPGTAAAQGTLTFGLVPSEDPRLMIADNAAIIEALRSSLGMPI